MFQNRAALAVRDNGIGPKEFLLSLEVIEPLKYLLFQCVLFSSSNSSVSFINSLMDFTSKVDLLQASE
jgi:hypothetical protein